MPSGKGCNFFGTFHHLGLECLRFRQTARLGMAYEQNGQYENAVSEFRQALLLTPDNTFARASLGYIYAVSGDEENARETIEHLTRESSEKYVSPYGMAELYAGLKDNPQALTQLEKAAEEHSRWLIFADVNPRFDNLRDEPRFKKILQKMNFTDIKL